MYFSLFSLYGSVGHQWTVSSNFSRKVSNAIFMGSLPFYKYQQLV